MMDKRIKAAGALLVFIGSAYASSVQAQATGAAPASGSTGTQHGTSSSAPAKPKITTNSKVTNVNPDGTTNGTTPATTFNGIVHGGVPPTTGPGSPNDNLPTEKQLH